MLDLVIAAALAQIATTQAAADPCHAVPPGDTNRSCPLWRLAQRFERFDIYANPASVVRGAASFEIHLRIVYPTDRPLGLRSAISRNRFDCTARTSQFLHITTYNAAGMILDDRDALPDEGLLQPVPADSPNGALLVEYCPR